MPTRFIVNPSKLRFGASLKAACELAPPTIPEEDESLRKPSEATFRILEIVSKDCDDSDEENITSTVSTPVNSCTPIVLMSSKLFSQSQATAGREFTFFVLVFAWRPSGSQSDSRFTKSFDLRHMRRNTAPTPAPTVAPKPSPAAATPAPSRFKIVPVESRYKRSRWQCHDYYDRDLREPFLTRVSKKSSHQPPPEKTTVTTTVTRGTRSLSDSHSSSSNGPMRLFPLCSTKPPPPPSPLTKVDPTVRPSPKPPTAPKTLPPTPKAAPVAQKTESEGSTSKEILAGLEKSLTHTSETTRRTKSVTSNPPCHASSVAIDSKIEQAMDLVKTHLMFAVREEVEFLRCKIHDLESHVHKLEIENAIGGIFRSSPMWRLAVFLLLLFHSKRVNAAHVQYYGRFSCNVDPDEFSCPLDTYASLAFYFGLIDGGGLTTNGTFLNSNTRVQFYDPTIGEQPIDPDTKPQGRYTEKALDYILNENGSDTLLALVGYETDCMQLSALAHAYNRASLMGKCSDQVGEANNADDAFVQFSSTQGAKYRALAKFFKSVGWTNVAVINFEDDSPDEKTYHSQLLDALSDNSITTSYVKKGGFSPFIGMYTGAERITDAILQSHLKTRIYIVISDNGRDSLIFMDCMATLGLLETGDYFVIVMGTVRFDEEFFLFGFGSRRETLSYDAVDRTIPTNLIRQYYRSFFYFSDNFTAYNEKWIKFQARINQDAGIPHCPPLCDRKTDLIKDDDPFNPFKYNGMSWAAVPNAYDLGKLLSETVSVHGAQILENASLLTKTMRNRSVETLLGYVSKFDQHGIAQREYLLWSGAQPLAGLPIYGWGKIAARVTPDGTGGFGVTWANLTEIGLIRGELPTSSPKCGFNMELCQKSYKIEIAIIAAAIVAALLVLGFIIYILRWIAYERKLDSSYFLVNRKNVMLYDISKFTSSRNGSMMQSAHSVRVINDYLKAIVLELQCTAKKNTAGGPSMQFYEQGMKAAYRRRRQKPQMVSLPSNKDDWKDIYDWHLAKFESALVTVRKIEKPQLKLTREMKLELDLLMTESHVNLNKFYGLINESDLIFTIHEYGPRKSLSDLLRNEDLRLDKIFKVSFVEDVSKGIHYLHEKSRIGYHGNLKSTNCVVDAYWRIKLSNFGMEKIRSDEPSPKPDDMLWCSPELIRRFCVKHDLSKEELRRCDVYSLAIVLYEIYGRQGPFGDDMLDSSEIIEQIKYPEGGAITRPDIHLITKSPAVIISTVEKCWNENPMERPSIKKVREWLKPLSKGMKGNIADNIMELLDRYRFNLEDVIRERTEQLEDEKRRNENLLLQLLPRSVALNLKNGKPVDAEYYEAVSIYFSDIVGFTSLSSKSTPMQIVGMLNEIYTSFDTVIDQFDCYKIETIGDAYVFVSGLPERNGVFHAGEVAGASIELLEFIKVRLLFFPILKIKLWGFIVRHCPEERLKLRIGIHTGPVVTGVVGIRMPRYCLFGDSVMMANNMESSGEAMKIQVSHEARELLVQCEGYELEMRGQITLKNKYETTAYWLLAYSREKRMDRLARNQHQYPQLERIETPAAVFLVIRPCNRSAINSPFSGPEVIFTRPQSFRQRSPVKTSTQRLFVKRKNGSAECLAETRIEKKSSCREKTQKSIIVASPKFHSPERVQKTFKEPPQKIKTIRTSWNYSPAKVHHPTSEPGPSTTFFKEGSRLNQEPFLDILNFVPADDVIEKMFEPLRASLATSMDQLLDSSPEKPKNLNHTPSVRLQQWKSQLRDGVKTRDHSAPPVQRLTMKPRNSQSTQTNLGVPNSSPRFLHTTQSAQNAIEGTAMEHRTLRDISTKARSGTWQPVISNDALMGQKTPVEFLSSPKMYQHESNVIRPVAYRPRVPVPSHCEGNRLSLRRPDPVYANANDTIANLSDILSTYQIVEKDPEMNFSMRSNHSTASNGPADQAAAHKSLLTTMSSSSSGIHVTPSPSDSGIIEYENVIREKELELREIRSTMEHNEEIIIKVYQEKEKTWKKELEALRSRLSAAETGESVLREQLANCQRQNMSMSESLKTLQDDKLALLKKCMKLERDIEMLKRNGCAGCSSKNSASLSDKDKDLRREVSELRQEVAKLKRAVDGAIIKD
ncbi:unnamed protein product [Caenorhabditis auriculariae]|uniref:guanylate cyclase n=1 Tax=Caenorhabditis auriculariae TaxID=2777116 RepID=A0A8S1H1I3_9PELO|nr:unnamed protein product [Caenorhabditis auriculariae]